MKFKNIPENGVDTGNELPHNCYSVYAELNLWRKEENLLANKILKFELNPESVKIKKILRKDFLEVELRAISTAYPNRNNSHFTRESLVKAIPTVYNKPLLGSFSVDNDDFRQHNSELKYDSELGDLYYDYTDSTSETPIGLIRSEDKVVVRDDENTGESWLCFTASIWVKYNYK